MSDKTNKFVVKQIDKNVKKIREDRELTSSQRKISNRARRNKEKVNLSNLNQYIEDYE